MKISKHITLIVLSVIFAIITTGGVVEPQAEPLEQQFVANPQVLATLEERGLELKDAEGEVISEDDDKKIILVKAKETDSDKGFNINLAGLTAIVSVVAAVFGLLSKLISNQINENKLRESKYLQDLEGKITKIEEQQKEDSKKSEDTDKENRDEILKKIELLQEEYKECIKVLTELKAESSNDKEKIKKLEEKYTELGKKIDDLMQTLLTINFNV